MKVSYDPHVFDYATVTNIIAEGCGDDGMGDSIYDFNWAYITGSVTISLGYNDNYDPTDSDLSQVYNQIYGPTPLAHVRLHISNCHYLPNVAIDPSPSSTASWENPNDFNFYIYDPTYIGSGFTDTICTPVPNVIAWDPPCTSAGSFQEVTIWGEHFGENPGTVFFTNANNPNAFVRTLPRDIRHWENDTHKINNTIGLLFDPWNWNSRKWSFFLYRHLMVWITQRTACRCS